MRLPIPLVIDPRLIVRAFEDLHAIASAARRIDEVLAAVDTLRALDARAREAIAAVEPLQGTAERLGRIADRLPGAPRRPARGGP